MLENRHTIRLKNYDYGSDGYYFVTICTKNRECLFGNVIHGKIVLNRYGNIIKKYWQEIERHFKNIILDAYAVMPNHIHGIINICRNNIVGVSFMKPETTMKISKSNHHMGSMNQTPTLGLIIRYFKSKSSFEIHKIGFNDIIWQRNYYEHIIRTENDFNKINEYVINNPLMWDRDRNNPINVE